MRAAERLTLVAAGPGRSGADTLLRVIGRHPYATVPAGAGPSLIAGITQLMVHASCDSEAWLPRRAAQALTDVVHRLDAIDAREGTASAELIEAAQAVLIDIPVYGPLLLPAEFPLAHWGAILRQALCSSAVSANGTHVALKIGACAAPVLRALLGPADSLVYTVRHPAETVIGLTESVIDGMRPVEAVKYVNFSLSQARRMLAATGCPTLVVRLEDLVSRTDIALSELLTTMGLSNEACWQRAARTALPADVNCSPRWDHPAVRPYRAVLATLAASWGYE